MFTIGLAIPSLRAASFDWGNATGNWSIGAAWTGAAAPTGTNATDVLTFGGDVGTTAGTAPNYTATNDIAASPFQINRIVLQATDANNLATDPPHVIAGNPLRFSLPGSQILQDGAGPITFNLPIELGIGSSLSLVGDGVGAVTLNHRISGFADVLKDGLSTFRFGTAQVSPVTPVPSDNTWTGALRLNLGTIRFNNNAQSGRTAVRANPIVFPASAASQPLLTCSSELRVGSVSGAVGKIESGVTGTNTLSEDIVITALTDATFGGTVRLGPPTGTGNDTGTLRVRGPGAQSFTGTMDIDKDLSVAGTLILEGSASLGTQTKGSVTIAGGALRIDNTAGNVNRLRDGSNTSTGVDLAGGGTLTLVGNAAGSSENVSRLQLSAQTGSTTLKTKQRSGQLGIGVVHRAAATAATVLTFASYERDATTLQPLDTVEFSAVDGAGTTLPLGVAGSNPRIVFSPAPTLVNTLPSNNTGTASTGWAVLKTAGGLAFATHNANGIAAATTTATWTSSNSANVNLAGSQTIGATTFLLNSLRIAPSAAAQTLSVATGGTLSTTGIILAGATDYTIAGAGTAALTGDAPRYLHVEQANLTLGLALGNLQPLAKSGAGTLVLTNAANNSDQQILAINNGIVRATPGTTLPSGELRFRGGVLEINGGGTFARPLVDSGTLISGPGTVNWSTTELAGTVPAPSSVSNDRGSGGFASIGGDLSVDLTTSGVNALQWEQKGFVQSGFALVFGSRTATGKVTLVNPLNITSAEVDVNYNAREIRVLDNPATTTDRAILSGVISGTVHNDLLKTGPGVLELSNEANTFAGLAIVQAGTLVISGGTNGIGIDVLPGATLAGRGGTTAILLESGATLSPGDNTLATLTATSLIWKAGALGRFDLGSANASDGIALGTGLFTRRGAGTYAFDFGGTGQNNQTYTLARFGSTDFVASDFSAVNLAAGVSGRFIVSAGALIFSTVPPQPIDLWRQLYFGAGATNSGNAADLADPDFDGLANLVEYIIGTNPTLPGSTGLPVVSGPLGARVFSFIRNTGATDVNVRVESTDGLLPAAWSPIATLNIGGAWSGIPGVTVNENGAGAVTITDTRGGGVRFYHLVVVHP